MKRKSVATRTLAILVKSVEFERLFSRKNLVKNGLRNGLNNDTLYSLMLVSINGPYEKKNFDPNPTIMKQKSRKQRRYTDKLSKSSQL